MIAEERMVETTNAPAVVDAYDRLAELASDAATPAWLAWAERWDNGERRGYTMLRDCPEPYATPLRAAWAAYVAAVAAVDWTRGFEIANAAYRAGAWRDGDALKWAGWNRQWSQYRKWDVDDDVDHARRRAVEACIRWVRGKGLEARWAV